MLPIQLTPTDLGLIGTSVTALIAFLGWIRLLRDRRRERRERLVELSNHLLITVATHQGTIASHRQVWASRRARWQIGVVAIAEVVQGCTRFGHPAAGIGAAARAVMGWDQAGSVALTQAVPASAAQIGMAAQSLAGCRDERLASAAIALAEAALLFRGERRQERALQETIDAFVVQLRRVSGVGRRWWHFWRRR